MPRILVVDDEPEVREAIQMVLEHAGYTVSVAANGRQALQVFKREPAQLVLCDLLMPDRDGLEAIQDLKRAAPEVKIIVMTGAMVKGSRDIMAAARHMGALEVMYKPLERADLLKAVERHIAPPQAPA